MKPVRRGPHLFKIELVRNDKSPKHLERHLAKAAKQTLDSLPASLLKKTLGNSSQEWQIALALVSSKEIQKLNHQYRRKNRPTDVLTFSRVGEKNPSGHLGDILISWEVAKAQYLLFSTSLTEEMQRLVVHGLLHLFGYDHETSAADAKRMFTLQEKILSTIRG